jgi:UrcA family protein
MHVSLPRGRVLPALAVAAALAAVAVPAATRAQVPAAAADVEVRHVSTRGLDLSQPNDLRRLHRRVAAATEQLCGEAWYEGLERRMLVDACRLNATLSAAPQIAARISRDVQYAEARAAARRAG